MCRLSRKVSLKPLLKVKDTSRWVTEILDRFHTNTFSEMDRRLMLGSSNCSCRGNRSTYHMFLNHRHLLPLAVWAPLPCLNSRIRLYPGTPSKFPMPNHHHLLPLAVRGPLRRLTSRICHYPGTPSKSSWSSDVQISKGFFYWNFLLVQYKQDYNLKLTFFFLWYDAAPVHLV